MNPLCSLNVKLERNICQAYRAISWQHTCQVLGKSKSEIARAPLIFAYNFVIEGAGKAGAQVLRVRFFSLFKQTWITNTERNKQYCFALPISFTINNPESINSVNLQCSIRIQFLFFATYNAFLPMTVTQIKIQKGWISIGEKRTSNICNIR